MATNRENTPRKRGRSEIKVLADHNSRALGAKRPRKQLKRAAGRGSKGAGPLVDIAPQRELREVGAIPRVLSAGIHRWKNKFEVSVRNLAALPKHYLQQDNPSKGLGLFAKTKIPAGAAIAFYGGETLQSSETVVTKQVPINTNLSPLLATAYA